MGDASDSADLERFMRSPEGRERLRDIRSCLVGQRISEVTFSAHLNAILVELEFESGGDWAFFDDDLNLDSIREEFAKVLQREYYRDYPERKPGRD